MVRLGVSLPALMQMLGHKDVRMTLRYVEVVNSTYNVNFTAPVKTLSYSTPFPNSLFHPSPLLLSGSTSLPFAKLSLPPVTFSSCSSLSWRIKSNVNFADSRSASLTSTTNSSASPQNECTLAG